MPIIEAFTKAGDVVLDPFAGPSSSLVAAALLRRDHIGIELEHKYCEVDRRRLAGVTRYLTSQRERARQATRVHGRASNGPKGPT